MFKNINQLYFITVFVETCQIDKGFNVNVSICIHGVHIVLILKTVLV